MSTHERCNFNIVPQGDYIHCVRDPPVPLQPKQAGGWPCSFLHIPVKNAVLICATAVKTGVAAEARCQRFPNPDGTVPIFFCCNGNDETAHRKILFFMAENDLIPMDIYGSYTNISFEYDWQTKRRKSHGQIRLYDFIPRLWCNSFPRILMNWSMADPFQF